MLFWAHYALLLCLVLLVARLSWLEMAGDE